MISIQCTDRLSLYKSSGRFIQFNVFDRTIEWAPATHAVKDNCIQIKTHWAFDYAEVIFIIIIIMICHCGLKWAQSITRVNNHGVQKDFYLILMFQGGE